MDILILYWYNIKKLISYCDNMRRSISYGLYCNILLYCHIISNTGSQEQHKAAIFPSYLVDLEVWYIDKLIGISHIKVSEAIPDCQGLGSP
jgi:hypothetical protein